MPVMGGMDALKKIRGDAWGANVPVYYPYQFGSTKRIYCAKYD